MSALEYIFNSLQTGYVFGRQIDYVKYPYFNYNLYLTYGNFIGWEHYGSSAVKNNLEELEWLIDVIFKMTPEEFIKTYERK